MAEKLIKVSKELNIGIDTITAWCENNGYSIGSDPNTMIDDNIYLHIADVFRPHLVPTILEQLEAKKTERIVPKTGTFKLNRPRIEERFQDIPWSCGVVSLFRDHNRGFKEYGLINEGDKEECFYHINNCLRGESIEDGDFVLYKAANDPNRGRLTAYSIRHPKEKDGFEFIFDFFWPKRDYDSYLVCQALVNALLPYSRKHWSLDEGYEQILADTKDYLLNCEAKKFGKYCETLVWVNTQKEQKVLSEDFLICLSKLILPFVDQDKLVPIFKSFSANDRDTLFGTIHKFENPSIAMKATESFLWGDYIKDALFIMEFEAHNAEQETCQLLRASYALKYENLSGQQRAWLYLNGFDDKIRETLPDKEIVQELKKYDTPRICTFYSQHKDESRIIVSACCEILRHNPGYEGSVSKSYIEKWSECLPELLPEIKRKLAKSMDDEYFRLWKYGVVDIAPSVNDFARILDKSKDTIDHIGFWIRCEYIDSEKAGIIFNQWYRENIAATNESPEERFNYIHNIYRQFDDSDIDFEAPKIESEYVPIIDWYETNVCGGRENKGVDFAMLSKYFYLFSEDEQVQIVRYIFGLMAAGVLEKSLEPLRVLTSKGQKQSTKNSKIHVCFEVDLVLEAMLKFQSEKAFSAERELLSLLLTNHTDEDFRDRSTPIIHYLFDRCGGFLWRKHVGQYNENGQLIGKKWIERTYEQPSGVVLCEGRELEKDYEGEKRYKCRSVLCARTKVELHESWKEYTMYDFCHIMDFDLSDVDYAGFRCENGKYLKFMTLLNRFMQFSEHLYCRECHRLMMPSGGLTNLAVTISTRFECVTDGCPEKGRRFYITHCFNPKCGEPVDERDSAKCPNGWYICKQCATCCSDYKNSQLLDFYKTYRPSAIPSGLELAVRNRIGHLEKNAFYCPQCGNALKNVTGRSDMDHICSNPNCRATFSLAQWHWKSNNRGYEIPY